MANGKQHRVDVFDGAMYLAQLLVEYADMVTQYMRKNLSTRDALQADFVDACFSTLKYSVENRQFMVMDKLGKSPPKPSLASHRQISSSYIVI